MFQFRSHVHFGKLSRRACELIAKPDQTLYLCPAINESPNVVKASFGHSDYQAANGLHDVTPHAGANPLIRSEKFSITMRTTCSERALQLCPFGDESLPESCAFCGFLPALRPPTEGTRRCEGHPVSQPRTH